MRLKLALLSGVALLFLSGSGLAVYNYWFEPSADQLAAEGLGELVEGETQILDTLTTPEGVIFRLVTYRTTEARCFDVTAEAATGPARATGGCGGLEEKASKLDGAELVVMSSGMLNVKGSFFTTTIGLAGPRVSKIRLFYSDGAADVRRVHTEWRLWFAVGSPSRGVLRWEVAG